MADQANDVESVRNHLWLLGFLGFLASLGVLAFRYDDPLFLFWFAFAGFFSFFGYRWEQLKFVGLLGLVGLAIAIIGVLGGIAL